MSKKNEDFFFFFFFFFFFIYEAYLYGTVEEFVMFTLKHVNRSQHAIALQRTFNTRFTHCILICMIQGNRRSRSSGTYFLSARCRQSRMVTSPWQNRKLHCFGVV